LEALVVTWFAAQIWIHSLEKCNGRHLQINAGKSQGSLLNKYKMLAVIYFRLFKTFSFIWSNDKDSTSIKRPRRKSPKLSCFIHRRTCSPDPYRPSRCSYDGPLLHTSNSDCPHIRNRNSLYFHVVAPVGLCCRTSNNSKTQLQSKRSFSQHIFYCIPRVSSY